MDVQGREMRGIYRTRTTVKREVEGQGQLGGRRVSMFYGRHPTFGVVNILVSLVVAEPSELIWLKCTNHHHKDNQG